MSNHPYSRLGPDQVIDAVESVGYRCDARLLALNSYENRVYQVGIEDDLPLIAKFYRPERWSEAQILEEHTFTQELVQADISVVAPLIDSNGISLHHYDGFMFALFTRRGGYPPELDNFDNLLVLGRTLGRIHLVGQSSSFAVRHTLDPERMLAKPREFLLASFIPRDLIPAYESLTLDLLEHVRSIYQEIGAKDFIRVHGDCHIGNILWRDNVAHFVDLDDCRTGPAIQDLWMMLNGSEMEQRVQFETLIEAYEEFASLDYAELKLIEPLRAMRMMHYMGWLANRWSDPAFPHHFPWFAQPRYWEEQILALKEQLSALQHPIRLTGQPY